MVSLSPIDVGHVVNMVLNDNKGNTLTEALISGIEGAVVFYCSRIKLDAEKMLAVVEKERAHGQ